MNWTVELKELFGDENKWRVAFFCEGRLRYRYFSRFDDALKEQRKIRKEIKECGGAKPSSRDVIPGEQRTLDPIIDTPAEITMSCMLNLIRTKFNRQSNEQNKKIAHNSLVLIDAQLPIEVYSAFVKRAANEEIEQGELLRRCIEMFILFDKDSWNPNGIINEDRAREYCGMKEVTKQSWYNFRKEYGINKLPGSNYYIPELDRAIREAAGMDW